MHHENIRIRPLVKWAGGKSYILEDLIRCFPQNRGRYIEPFVGGGAVFFSRNAGSSIISDLNQDLITLYKVIAREPEKLILELDGMAKQYSETYYYDLRATKFKNPVKIAARFIFLNKTCFNGLYRTNSRGEYNVSFGKRKTCPQLYEMENLLRASKLLKCSKIIVGDFEGTIDLARKGDLVYCDPPYVPLSNTAYFTSYTSSGFSWDDHIRLKEAAESAAARGAQVIISNSATSEVQKLYSKHVITKIKAPRFINSCGEKRGAIDELLITIRRRRFN